MGRIKAPLAEKAVAKLAANPGMHAVGGVSGLYLCVEGNGRSWILRYSLNGRRRDYGLGSFFDLTLAEARETAREVRKLVRQGIDPIEQRREGRQAHRLARIKRMTFAQCVTAYLSAHGDTWRNAKHRQQWQNTLDTYAAPVIGELDVSAVDTGLVMQILEPIWKTKNETASRVRGRIESVLDWATVRGYRAGDNPARWKGHLGKLLPARSKVAKVEHHAALPYADIGAFMVDLAKLSGIGARALEFTILTAVRSGEVRGAKPEEFDLEARVWTIPAERMKMNREHRVPLSDAATTIFKALPKTTDGFVFPSSRRGKPISEATMAAVLKRMGLGVTVHGFRSTFRDWAAECTAYPREVAEMALAHAIGSKVEAAYRRGDLFEKRKRLMADWSTYCAKPSAPAGEVVPIGAGAAG